MSSRRLAWITVCLAVALLGAMETFAQPKRTATTLFYMTDREVDFQSFKAHLDQISIVGPQVFSVADDGVVWGQVDPRVLTLARTHNVQVMPLIRNPGFDQEIFHKLLHHPAARARTITTMVDLAREHDFYGWQFDFENIHLSDRDALTLFYRETAEALHSEGFKLSIAVVPAHGQAGATPYHQFMQANWRGGFDVKALAEIGDFISLMTYDQHTGNTPPGPVSGLPWMKTMLDYALAQGVAPEKLSMGIPSYSRHWYATHNETKSLHATARGLDHATALSLVERYDVDLVWLDKQGASYGVWTNRGTFEYLFLEDRRAFDAKLDLFETYQGLHGISVWVLGLEDPGIWDVLRDRVEPIRFGRR